MDSTKTRALLQIFRSVLISVIFAVTTQIQNGRTQAESVASICRMTALAIQHLRPSICLISLGNSDRSGEQFQYPSTGYNTTRSLRVPDQFPIITTWIQWCNRIRIRPPGLEVDWSVTSVEVKFVLEGGKTTEPSLVLEQNSSSRAGIRLSRD
jgi:hypothetical protein